MVDLRLWVNVGTTDEVNWSLWFRAEPGLIECNSVNLWDTIGAGGSGEKNGR